MVAATLPLPDAALADADDAAAVTDRRREPLTARAITLILVALIHVLLLLALLFAARTPPPPSPPQSTVVRLIPLALAAPKPKSTPKPVKQPNAVKMPAPIVKMQPDKVAPAALFKTEMFDAVDITKLPSHKTEQADTSSDVPGAGQTGTAADKGYGPAVGTGPHGEQLFAAEWYREPTNADVAPYLPKHLPDIATADIMCRTIERFGVEDCQELGESPPGTGLSRAIRQAGWQFKVKPVRLGQKFEVGTWVRIRYTITTTRREDAGGN